MSHFLSSILSSPIGAWFGNEPGSPGAPLLKQGGPNPGGDAATPSLDISIETTPTAAAAPTTTEAAVNVPPIRNRLRRPHTSMETKVLIVSMHGQGKSYREIGKAVGADHKVVSAVIRNWTQNHSLDRKKGGGRPRKTSPQTDGMIVRAVTANRYVSLNDLRENLALRDLSKSTIARRITAVKMMETARAGLQESI